MSKAPLVTQENFDQEVLKADKLVMVDFFAEWCGPCRMMEPVIDELIAKMSDKAKIVKLDTEKSQELALKYSITGIPCLILFKNGQEIDRRSGYQPEDALTSWIEEKA